MYIDISSVLILCVFIFKFFQILFANYRIEKKCFICMTRVGKIIMIKSSIFTVITAIILVIISNNYICSYTKNIYSDTKNDYNF